MSFAIQATPNEATHRTTFFQAWHLSGDVYTTEPGMKPWISEMYGYSFSAAKHGMWHNTDHLSMMYPGYLPRTPPRLIHYGLQFLIATKSANYTFDKHWHYNFNGLACQVSTGTVNEGGLFPMPPRAADLTSPQVRSSALSKHVPPVAVPCQLLWLTRFTLRATCATCDIQCHAWTRQWESHLACTPAADVASQAAQRRCAGGA
jgi:hypothetical protein